MYVYLLFLIASKYFSTYLQYTSSALIRCSSCLNTPIYILNNIEGTIYYTYNY